MGKAITIGYGISISGSASNDAQSAQIVQESVNIKPNLRFDTGTAVNQAQILYSRNLSFTGQVTLDLYNLLTGLGTANITKAKLLYIYNTDATHSLNVGGATSNAWTACVGTDVVQPGGILFKSAAVTGWTVDATHRNLLLDAGTFTLAVTVAIIGVGT